MTKPFETPEESAEYLGVQFSQKGVALVDSGKKLVFVPKEKIRQIHLRQGFQAERPLVQLGFSIVLILIGLYPLPHLFLWLIVGGTAYDFEFLLLLLIPVGLWFVKDGLKKGLYFELIMDDDKRKIPFQKQPEKRILEMFIAQANVYGYSIDNNLEI